MRTIISTNVHNTKRLEIGEIGPLYKDGTTWTRKIRIWDREGSLGLPTYEITLFADNREELELIGGKE